MKLEIGFAEQDAWRTLTGGRDVLALLRGLGVSAVETPVGAETDVVCARASPSSLRGGGLGRLVAPV